MSADARELRREVAARLIASLGVIIAAVVTLPVQARQPNLLVLSCSGIKPLATDQFELVRITGRIILNFSENTASFQDFIFPITSVDGY